MSDAKVTCPSCGREWDGPVVFCGECGASLTAGSSLLPGDRAARVPPAPSSTTARPEYGPRLQPQQEALLLSTAQIAPPTPVIKELRTTATGLQPGVQEHGRTGRRSRRGIVSATPVEPAPRPAEPVVTETRKMLEDLDAGFDAIVRPSEGPEVSVVSITPSSISELPAASEVAVVPSAPAPEPEPPAPAPEHHDAEMAEVRALFVEMAPPYARPIREFMIEVSWGDPTKEWLDVAAPAASALRSAADTLEMFEHRAAFEGLLAALGRVASKSALEREAKEDLLGAYQKLIELMPEPFALEGERGRREPLIVRSLLLQVPGMHKVVLDKIYAAGLGSLEMLYKAGAKELAETTGIELDVAARVCERVQRYRREAAELDPGKDRARERAELERLTAELARHHEEHERLAAAWSNEAMATRARVRRARADTLLQITVLLARVGEVDRVNQIEKLPFQQKIRELSRYVEEAKRQAARS